MCTFEILFLSHEWFVCLARHRKKYKHFFEMSSTQKSMQGTITLLKLLEDLPSLQSAEKLVASVIKQANDPQITGFMTQLIETHRYKFKMKQTKHFKHYNIRTRKYGYWSAYD